MNPPVSGLSFYKRKLFEWLMFLVLPALGFGAHFFYDTKVVPALESLATKAESAVKRVVVTPSKDIRIALSG